MKSIAILVIAILTINVVVISVSLMQQTSKLNEAGANVTVLQSEVDTLNGQLVTLRGSVAALQSSLTDSDARASTLQSLLTKSQNTVTDLQSRLAASEANATITTSTPNPAAPAPANGPPTAFTLNSFEVTPDVIDPGSIVTAVLNLTNTGGQTGTYSVVMKITQASTKIQDIKTQITLSPGESQNVSMIVPLYNDGEYVFAVDRLSDKVTVILR